jgi:zinc transport system permease protein
MEAIFHLGSFLEYGFLGRALVAGLLMSLTCGLLSPFIVLRRLSFSADGLAHASLGGLALGMYLLNSGPAPTLAGYGIAFAFTCGVAATIAYFSGGHRLQSDTAVGACYVAAFALGILLLTSRRRSTGHLEHFFFGSILAVNPLECWLLAGLASLTAVFCFGYWRWLGQWTFDEDLARASKVKTAWLRYTLILLIAATVILSTRVVGVLLVTAMLILPGAVGTLSGSTMPVIVFFSIASAMSSVALGMVVSNTADLPPGPVIVLLAFGCFLTAFFRRRRRDVRTLRSSSQIISPIVNYETK